MILLTDEEIEEINDRHALRPDSATAEAARAQLKKVVEWLEDNKTPFLPSGTWDGGPCVKAELHLFKGEWQALKKEAGL